MGRVIRLPFLLNKRLFISNKPVDRKITIITCLHILLLTLILSSKTHASRKIESFSWDRYAQFLGLLFTIICNYAEVIFLSLVIFVFILFEGMVMYANEVETKEN